MLEGVVMKRKPARGEFVKGLLERLSGSDDSGSFHASVFKYAFDGIRARFRDLK
jgi:hypothetical protein